MIRAAAAFLLALTLPAWAEAPVQSLRPVARPDVAQQAAPAPPAAILAPLQRSLRPVKRPRSVRRKAKQRAAQISAGSVCGDPRLQGVPVGMVTGKIAGCGVADAVRLRSVSGVALSQHAVLDCTTARTLRTWVDKTLKPSVGRRGGGVARIRVAAHYACRTRNSQKGARISEHGKGRAIDISGVRLRDGTEIMVLTGWGSGKYGRLMRQLHKGACGPFGTVLGPESDRFHKDHFHFDTARYRSGSYCR